MQAYNPLGYGNFGGYGSYGSYLPSYSGAFPAAFPAASGATTWQAQGQQQQQAQTLTGRFVSDFSEVAANDVPMNGSPSIFVKQDMTEAQARFWTPDGQIKVIPFKPTGKVAQNGDKGLRSDAKDFEDVRLSGEKLDALAKQLADVSGQLARLEKAIAGQGVKTGTAAKAKKEAESE